MFDKTIVRLLLAAALVAMAVTVRADNTINLDMVPVSDAGNLSDGTAHSENPSGQGAVAYNYKIGKYDVTLGQYATFLSAVAATDTYGLYNSFMSADFAPTEGIARSGSPGSYSYSVTGSATGASNMPVIDVTWGDAARFTNWLDNGQPTGAQSLTTTESGAYYLNGATSNLQLMAVLSPSHSGANAPKYFLPTEDEWYKAAYYVGGGTNAGYWNYPTKSNLAPENSLVLAATSTNDANYNNSGYTDPTNFLTPVGTFAASPGPYGTYDMGGDVFQWNEASLSGSFRGLRGGSWYHPGSSYLASSNRADDVPTVENGAFGFRVASSVAVPEPGSLTLLLACAVAFGIWRQRRNA